MQHKTKFLPPVKSGIRYPNHVGPRRPGFIEGSFINPTQLPQGPVEGVKPPIIGEAREQISALTTDCQNPEEVLK